MSERRPSRLTRQLVKVYATADPRSLAAGRIALAIVLLVDLARRAERIHTWYADDGLLPTEMLRAHPTFEWVFTFFAWASRPHEVVLGFLLCAVSYVALLLGFWTRVAHVAAFLCVLSLHGRVLFIANGGDVVLGELCLWTMFLPTGLRYSIDALRARTSAAATPSHPAPVASLAAGALLLQIASIYFFNAVQKTGPTWHEGTALHYVLHQSRFVTSFGLFAREHFSDGALRFLTHVAHGLEWIVAPLVLFPIGQKWTRRIAIACMFLLHLGFALFLNLALFVPAMLAFAPNLLGPDDWNAFESWRARHAKGATALGPLRSIASRLSRFAAHPATSRVWKAASEVLVAVAMTIAGSELLAENFAVTRFVRVEVPPPMKAAVTSLQLFEAWSMFAPDAPTTDMNVFVDAVTADGRHVDPLSEAANPHVPAPGPQILDRLEQDPFFCDYLPRIVHRPDYQPALADWILRYPERTGRDGDRIASFEGFVVEQDSPRPGETSPPNVRTAPFIKWPRR